MQNTTGSSNDQEFLGITQNDCTFQGMVIGDPVIQGDNYAYFILRTSIREQDPNGQWVDTPSDIPMMTTDVGKVGTISSYIKDGRKLLLYAYYKPWMNAGTPQHAFMIRQIKFGPKKREFNSGQAPGLPVS